MYSVWTLQMRFTIQYLQLPSTTASIHNSFANTNMRVQATITALTSVASGFLMPRQSNETAPAKPNVAAAQYDGLANHQLYSEHHPDYLTSTCFYPVADPKFNLEAYLGTWYQVAGTTFGPTAGANCVTANYALNVCCAFYGCRAAS
jgi:hypothetical protein